MRVVVGLAAGQEPEAVAEELRARGARYVQDPAPSLPDVLVAEFPEDDSEAIVASVAALPGVRYAERDRMRSADS